MTSPTMCVLTKSLQKYFLETKFKDSAGDTISFYDVKTANHFWSYSEIILANGISEILYDTNEVARSTGQNNQILSPNYLIGGARIRQLKVRNNSCPIHDYMVRNFPVCYDAFSQNGEDKSNFGEQNGYAWTYNNASAVRGTSYYGIVSVYPLGGFYSILKKSNSLSLLNTLKEKFWLTKGTRLIIYEFAVYNANVNLMCVIKLAFEFPHTGGVLPSATFQTVHVYRYSSVLDFIVLAAEILYICYVIVFLIEEMVEFSYFGNTYFKNCWNWVDLSIVIFSFAAIGFRIHREILLYTLAKTNADYPSYDEVVDYQIKYEYISAFLLCLFMLKLFKYLEYSPILKELNLTLKTCATNVVGFALMFFVVFFAYAELGYLLFGTQVIGFCGFYVSMITLIRTILGDFDYEEIEESDSLYAPIYFLSYIFIVFFVLMNMFIAIVNDAYTDTKTEKSVKKRSKREELCTLGVYKFFKMIRLSCLIPRSEKNPESVCLTIYEIIAILKGCGFSEEDITKVFNQWKFTIKRKSQYVNLYELIKNVDRKVYLPPEMPRILDSINGTQNKVALISYEEFLRTEEKIRKIQAVLAHFTAKLDSLLDPFPQC
ncbi:hypothetical protein RN001_004974 [Aquatica leii]|uniref:Polycystic kidney disease 2-like 1 protein n=1 Tax=Aquatica leii TaxID=1421715 RepID=A0AAN7SRY6_9COLE|nr:hypothetical protein RN001_004974 [Aquatica leii]